MEVKHGHYNYADEDGKADIAVYSARADDQRRHVEAQTLAQRDYKQCRGKWKENIANYTARPHKIHRHKEENINEGCLTHFKKLTGDGHDM